MFPKNKQKIRFHKPGSRLRCALTHWLALGESYQFFLEKRSIFLTTNIIVE